MTSKKYHTLRGYHGGLRKFPRTLGKGTKFLMERLKTTAPAKGSPKRKLRTEEHRKERKKGASQYRNRLKYTMSQGVGYYK